MAQPGGGPSHRSLAPLLTTNPQRYHVSRRLASITLDNLHDLPPRCRKCVFWELDPVSQARALEVGDPALEKEAWISSVLLEWGSCGKIIYVDGGMMAVL